MLPCLIEPGAGAGQRLGQSAEFLAGGLRLMLGRGDLIARAVELGMRLLCLLAQSLGLEPRRFRLGNGGGKLGVGLGGAALRLGGLRLERGKPAPLDQPRARGTRRAGLEAVAVPAPEVAVPGNEPLPGPELHLQRATLRGLDHADLLKPPRQHGRPLDEIAERNGASGQRGVVAGSRGQPPMRGRGLLARGIEIVAERGAERLLVAGRDLDLLHDRRPIMYGRQELRQRGELGLELLARELCRGGEGSGPGFRRLRLLLIGLRRLELGFDALHRRGKLGERGIQAA